MALRNQPFLPLYIQDFMTDERLAECSAQSTGVYIRIMCLMHKSEHYGKILLRQNSKQTGEQIFNFAVQFAKHLPYTHDVIFSSLKELIAENVLSLDGDFIVQKRMVKDNLLSETRAKAARGIGKYKPSKDDFAPTKMDTNPESESENEDLKGKEGVGGKPNLMNDGDSNSSGGLFQNFSPAFEAHWERWKRYLAEKGKHPTYTTVTEHASLLKKQTEQLAVSMISYSINGGYTSLFSPKIEDSSQSERPKTQRPTGQKTTR